MGFNSRIDFELYDAIQDLLDENLIEEKSPEHGIALRVIDLGYDSLSPKQRTLYNAVVVPALEKRVEEIRVNEIIGSNPE